MEFLTKIFDITKLPSKFFAWVALLSGLYLFLPSSAITALNLGQFPSEYKAYAGVAFVGSSSFLGINLSIWIWSSMHRAWNRRGHKRKVELALDDLDSDEIAVLREFLLQGRHVIELPVDHPTVAGLINKRVIYVASRTGYRDLAGNVFPVQLSNITKKLLTPALLFIPQEPTQQEIERIRGERPIYMGQLEKAERLRGGLFW